MSTTLNLISQTNLAGIPLLPLLRDALYGIFGLILILLFHGSAINFIMLRFERLTNGNLKVRQYNRVFFHFYFTFFFIALIHLTEIIIWTIYILELNLIEDGIKAMIFVGSCYTTIGFIEDILPAGWKSLAFFISFSGLFAMAWTTSVMISMTSTYKAAWNLKHHQRDPNAS
ncbi:hypothetical protein AOC21_03660 [Polynucleobacter sp. VK25]|uniref:hypothetical protein n=1 Tax=Polynucleobacter sp. VK25 TaxID=1758398 RepID=UPI001BFCF87B|nr:hypothetical protein [Polynucleobacter sp. VK25]QWD69000.1 hypothetical protein AOC21_03660 [Polynucleobacter sp. VK25]